MLQYLLLLCTYVPVQYYCRTRIFQVCSNEKLVITHEHHIDKLAVTLRVVCITIAVLSYYTQFDCVGDLIRAPARLGLLAIRRLLYFDETPVGICICCIARKSHPRIVYKTLDTIRRHFLRRPGDEH